MRSWCSTWWWRPGSFLFGHRAEKRPAGNPFKKSISEVKRHFPKSQGLHEVGLCREYQMREWTIYRMFCKMTSCRQRTSSFIERWDRLADVTSYSVISSGIEMLWENLEALLSLSFGHSWDTLRILTSSTADLGNTVDVSMLRVLAVGGPDQNQTVGSKLLGPAIGCFFSWLFIKFTLYLMNVCMAAILCFIPPRGSTKFPG